MINLLPPEEKQSILLEKKKRSIIILWFFFLFFLCCFILVLSSVRFHVRGEFESQKIILEEIKKNSEQSEIRKLQKEIDLINSVLVQLKHFYENKTYLTEILEKISNTLPEKTYLTNFSVISIDKDQEDKEKTNFNVSLSGFSANREILFDFKKNLEKNENFEEIYFPATNWTKPSDIDFFVTFKINNK